MDREETKIVQWNCHGAKTNLSSILATFQKETPVYALQETFLKEHERLSIPGYRAIRNDRKGETKGGGVAILVPDKLAVKDWEAFNTDNCEGITVTLQTAERELKIINVYFPKGNIKEEDLEEIGGRIDQKTIITGDFNAIHPTWGSHTCNRSGLNLMQFIENRQLVVLNDGSATRINPKPDQADSAIDVTMVTENLSTANWRVLQASISDHLPIEVSIRVQITLTPSSTRPSFQYKKADWAKFQKELRESVIKEESRTDVDTYARELTNLILRSAAKSIPNKNLPSSILSESKKTPQKKKNKNPVPWWTDECSQTHKEMKKALKKYRRFKSHENRAAYKEIRKQAKKVKTNAKRFEFRKHCQTLDPSKTQVKELWGKLKAMKGKGSTAPSKGLKIPVKTETDKQKAEILAQHFFEVSSNRGLGEVEVERRKSMMKTWGGSSDQGEQDSFINADITEAEVRKAMRNKKESSAGVDIITYTILKHLPDKTITELTELFNRVWKSGHIPQEWKTATVVPLLKAGKAAHDAGSYRPIALTSHMGKLLETVVKQRLQFFLEKNNVFSKSQSGFRKRRSTIDQIVRLENDVKKGFRNKEKTVGIFLDVSKAYDQCWREGATEKLTGCGVNGRALRYVQNFLTNRLFSVRVGNERSGEYEQENGIPQGAVISPLIFAVMVNDLPGANMEEKARISQYADDTALWRSNRNVNRAYIQLQRQVDATVEWMKKWGFSLNAEKTVGMVFSRGGRDGKKKQIGISIDKKIIKFVNSTTYLGMTLDKTLSWSRHIGKLVERLRGLNNIMRYIRGQGWGASTRTLITFYKSFIRGVIDYGSVVYDSAPSTSKKKIDKVQNLALRCIAYMPQSCSTEALEVVLGIHPLELRRKELRLNVAVKVKQEIDHPMKEAFSQNPLIPGERDISKEHYPIGWKTVDEITEDPDLTEMVQKIATHRETVPTWELVKPDLDVSLAKKEKPTTLEVAVNYITELGKDALKVYTDGSKDDKGRLGIGIHIPAWRIRRNFSITKDASIFTAEMTAILKALELVTENPPRKVIILTDSLSSIQGIEADEECSRPDLAKEILVAVTGLYNSGCRVQLAWIPAHIGIAGNERADKEANKGRHSNNIITTGLGKSEAKSKIRQIINNEWKKKWDSSEKGRNAYPLFNSPSTKCQIRNILKIPTNRKILKLQMGRANFLLDEEDEYCEECMKENSIQHLFECDLYDKDRYELDTFCKENDIPKTTHNILNNKFHKEGQRALKKFISRIEVDI
jgi:ribonuclease HI